VQRLLHLNRGLPRGACLRFKYNTRPEIQGEISPRIKCSSLRFKCNDLLHLNRGLPGSAVYDLSTVRQLLLRPKLSNSGGSGSYRFQVRFDEVAGLIFYPPVRELVFYGVSKLNVSD